MGVPFLGRVPLDPALSRAAEEGRSVFGDLEGEDGGAASGPGADSEGPGQQAQRAQQARGAAGARHAVAAASVPALQSIIDQLLAAAEHSRNPPLV